MVGSELDGTRETKDQVVQETLHQLLRENPIEPDQVYMIGDRKFDVEGARALGVESVGVTYGYGSKEELKEAKRITLYNPWKNWRNFCFVAARNW